jgi:hypothetical protein
MRERSPDGEAGVVDITPPACPNCREPVGVDEAFCGFCGADLANSVPTFCTGCGNALRAGSSFCTGCGTPVEAPEMDAGEAQETDELPEIRKAPEQDAAPNWWRRPWVMMGAAALVVILALGGAALWYFVLRGPDLTAYDDGVSHGLQLAAAAQESTDELNDPGSLNSFAAEASDIRERVEQLRERALSFEIPEYRSALVAFFDAEIKYLKELERLANLPSAEAIPSEYQRAPELAGELETAMEAAIALRDDAVDFGTVALSPTALTQTLSKLAEYRAEVQRERVRIARANRRRAARLAELKATTDQMDGIIGRYSDARGNLATWIDGVNSHGASFMEAYDVLFQHAELRRQLREELAALDVPDPFGADKSALLAVMDAAINATEDASRGISEYQFSWAYYSYDQTPGWLSFKSATSQISKDYGAAQSTYAGRKEELFRTLSRKRPLPELPD